MKTLMIGIAIIASATQMRAGIMQRGKVQLICHRTANRDIPENTLESLALAARMGCNIVEVDVRRTLDGELVLNHDGYLERLTDGMGDVENTTLQELQLLDFGGWMSNRFAPMRIARFSDTLRVARELGIGLALDIKQKDLGPAIFAALQREGMLERVTFGGEDGNADELHRLYPAASRDPVEWLGPECTEAQVKKLHSAGKFVVANFSANPHEMDLSAMQAAVAAGVDAINVDYPRIGADAVGRPVEAKVAALVQSTLKGSTSQRAAAIQELSQYDGFPTKEIFIRCMRDADDRISRAGALALVTAHPSAPEEIFVEALSASSMSARKNAAWALGITHAPVNAKLLERLDAKDLAELRESTACDQPVTGTSAG